MFGQTFDLILINILITKSIHSLTNSFILFFFLAFFFMSFIYLGFKFKFVKIES